MDQLLTPEEAHIIWMREAMTMVRIYLNAGIQQYVESDLTRPKKPLLPARSQLGVYLSGTVPPLPKPEIARMSCEM
jgi:hypothetical protein